MIAIYLETGKKRVFAAAMEWPGWCRAGRDEGSAIEALGEAATRYAVVARTAGVAFEAGEFEVVERLPGTSTTDFGAPAMAPAADGEPLDRAGAQRCVKLVRAAWTVFDAVVADAPLELIKGPRGGGRNRDKILAHVVNAEASYARKLGLRLPPPDPHDAPAVAAFRASEADMLESAMAEPAVTLPWLPRYVARRIAWHVLDHAWEIEDKTPR